MCCRMGALPWTLRTSVQQQELKVSASESSPLPKSVTTAHDLENRRGSLDNIQKHKSAPITDQTNDGILKTDLTNNSDDSSDHNTV